MNTKGNSLDDVTEKLVDAILSDAFISRENLLPRVRIILKAWVNSNDRPNNYDNIKTPQGILQRTIEGRGIEREFWRHKLIGIIGKDKMQPHYDELTSILIKEGYRKT